jgi:hypothetical protein
LGGNLTNPLVAKIRGAGRRPLMAVFCPSVS